MYAHIMVVSQLRLIPFIDKATLNNSRTSKLGLLLISLPIQDGAYLKIVSAEAYISN